NLKDILCDIEADPDRGYGDLSSEQQCCPADPIRTGLGSSGGRPPYLDSNLEFLDAFARSASSSDLLERLLAVGRFLAQHAKNEVTRCVGRRDFARGPCWVFGA